MSSGTIKEYEAKVVLLGNSGVGKTSLVFRYVQGEFKDAQNCTIGATFLTKRMFVNNSVVKLQIWDTAGQERFRSMTPMYYRGSAAAILVYDITNQQSFDSVKGWVEELMQNLSEPIIITIAGNKSDLEAQKQVSTKDAQIYADGINAAFFEVSAKQDKGLEELFLHVCQCLIAKGNKPKESDDTANLEAKPVSNKTDCC